MTSGTEGYDIHALPDGRLLVAEAAAGAVRLYDAAGTGSTDLITGNLPQQITALPNGNYAVAFFSSNLVVEFTLAGATVRSFTVASPRSAYPLTNGNWLVAAGASAVGLAIYDPATGTKLSTIGTGFTWQYINKARVAPSLIPIVP